MSQTAKFVKFEEVIGKLATDVDKLINITTQHGTKIKDLMLASANSVSKVEFMASVTTTRFQQLNVMKSMTTPKETVKVEMEKSNHEVEIQVLKSHLAKLEAEMFQMNYKWELKKIENEFKKSKNEHQHSRNHIKTLEDKVDALIETLQQSNLQTESNFLLTVTAQKHGGALVNDDGAITELVSDSFIEEGSQAPSGQEQIFSEDIGATAGSDTGTQVSENDNNSAAVQPTSSSNQSSSRALNSGGLSRKVSIFAKPLPGEEVNSYVPRHSNSNMDEAFSKKKQFNDENDLILTHNSGKVLVRHNAAAASTPPRSAARELPDDNSYYGGGGGGGGGGGLLSRGGSSGPHTPKVSALPLDPSRKPSILKLLGQSRGGDGIAVQQFMNEPLSVHELFNFNVDSSKPWEYFHAQYCALRDMVLCHATFNNSSTNSLTPADVALLSTDATSSHTNAQTQHDVNLSAAESAQSGPSEDKPIVGQEAAASSQVLDVQDVESKNRSLYARLQVVKEVRLEALAISKLAVDGVLGLYNSAAYDKFKEKVLDDLSRSVPAYTVPIAVQTEISATSGRADDGAGRRTRRKSSLLVPGGVGFVPPDTIMESGPLVRRVTRGVDMNAARLAAARIVTEQGSMEKIGSHQRSSIPADLVAPAVSPRFSIKNTSSQAPNLTAIEDLRNDDFGSGDGRERNQPTLLSVKRNTSTTITPKQQVVISSEVSAVPPQQSLKYRTTSSSKKARSPRMSEKSALIENRNSIIDLLNAGAGNHVKMDEDALVREIQHSDALANPLMMHPSESIRVMHIDIPPHDDDLIRDGEGEGDIIDGPLGFLEAENRISSTKPLSPAAVSFLDVAMPQSAKLLQQRQRSSELDFTRQMVDVPYVDTSLISVKTRENERNAFEESLAELLPHREDSPLLFDEDGVTELYPHQSHQHLLVDSDDGEEYEDAELNEIYTDLKDIMARKLQRLTEYISVQINAVAERSIKNKTHIKSVTERLNRLQESIIILNDVIYNLETKLLYHLEPMTSSLDVCHQRQSEVQSIVVEQAQAILLLREEVAKLKSYTRNEVKEEVRKEVERFSKEYFESNAAYLVSLHEARDSSKVHSSFAALVKEGYSPSLSSPLKPPSHAIAPLWDADRSLFSEKEVMDMMTQLKAYTKQYQEMLIKFDHLAAEKDRERGMHSHASRVGIIPKHSHMKSDPHTQRERSVSPITEERKINEALSKVAVTAKTQEEMRLEVQRLKNAIGKLEGTVSVIANNQLRYYYEFTI
jgi:hypothetical protein